MDTSDKRYQVLVEELKNCILSENLEISQEEHNMFNYRYHTHINFDGTLIPVEITLHTLDETISICFRHNVVPEDRFEVTVHLVNYINMGIRLQHFAGTTDRVFGDAGSQIGRPSLHIQHLAFV